MLIQIIVWCWISQRCSRLYFHTIMQLVCEVKWLNPFYIPGAGTAMATATHARTIRARMVGRESDLQMNNRWWTTGCWLYSQTGTFFHVSPMCVGYVGNVWLDHGVYRGQSHEYPHHFLWSLTDGAIYHAFWWLSTELWYLYWRYHSLVPSHLYNAKTLSFFSKIMFSINESQTQFAHSDTSHGVTVGHI